jgi:hypothetical protein
LEERLAGWRRGVDTLGLEERRGDHATFDQMAPEVVLQSSNCGGDSIRVMAQRGP